MVKSISGTNSTVHLPISQASNIEEDLGWHGNLSLSETTTLLDGQRPYTYIISRSTPTTFWLSFVRENDQGIVHIQFDRTEDDQWHYTNGADNIDPSLTQIIRRMMHLTEPSIGPTPLRR